MNRSAEHRLGAFPNWFLTSRAGVRRSNPVGHPSNPPQELSDSRPEPCPTQTGIRTFRAELEEKLEQLALPNDKPVKIWVADESRFVLNTQSRRCWAMRGQRVVIPQQQRYEWEYVCGALEVLEGDVVNDNHCFLWRQSQFASSSGLIVSLGHPCCWTILVGEKPAVERSL